MANFANLKNFQIFEVPRERHSGASLGNETETELGPDPGLASKCLWVLFDIKGARFRPRFRVPRRYSSFLKNRNFFKFLGLTETDPEIKQISTDAKNEILQALHEYFVNEKHLPAYALRLASMMEEIFAIEEWD